MYVVIGANSYTEISNLSFAPETDVAGTQIPVNEFSVDVHTQDEFYDGAETYLYDDMDNLWAHYWLIFAERISPEIIHIRAQSKIALLDRLTMNPVMYNNALVTDVLDAVFAPAGGNSAYTIANSMMRTRIDGFCPEQTARERLLWVCMVLRAYVKTFFTDTIDIMDAEDDETIVPISKTFWQPSTSYGDWVTHIRINEYSFTQGTPQTTDKWVTDGTDYWIVTTHEVILANPSAPMTAPMKMIDIKDVMLINEYNSSALLSFLAKYYFNRETVTLDAINNAEFMPGQKLLVYTDDTGHGAAGYLAKCSFSFGTQARAKMTLTAAEDRDFHTFVIDYVYDTRSILKQSYMFPLGYIYGIENPYPEATWDGHRHIYRPINDVTEGTVTADLEVVTEPLDIALDLELSSGILTVVSVDSADADEEGVVTIA